MLLKVKCHGDTLLLPVTSATRLERDENDGAETILGYRLLTRDEYEDDLPNKYEEPYRASHAPDVVADAIEAALAYTARRDIPLPSFNQDGKELVYAWVLDLTRTKITLEKMPVPVEREQISFGKATIDIKDNTLA